MFVVGLHPDGLRGGMDAGFGTVAWLFCRALALDKENKKHVFLGTANGPLIRSQSAASRTLYKLPKRHLCVKAPSALQAKRERGRALA